MGKCEVSGDLDGSHWKGSEGSEASGRSARSRSATLSLRMIPERKATSGISDCMERDRGTRPGRRTRRHFPLPTLPSAFRFPLLRGLRPTPSNAGESVRRSLATSRPTRSADAEPDDLQTVAVFRVPQHGRRGRRDARRRPRLGQERQIGHPEPNLRSARLGLAHISTLCDSLCETLNRSSFVVTCPTLAKPVRGQGDRALAPSSLAKLGSQGLGTPTSTARLGLAHSRVALPLPPDFLLLLDPRNTAFAFANSTNTIDAHQGLASTTTRSSKRRRPPFLPHHRSLRLFTPSQPPHHDFSDHQARRCRRRHQDQGRLGGA